MLAGPADAIASFEQQYNIFISASDRFKSSIFDLQQLVQAGLLDKELDAAELLLKK